MRIAYLQHEEVVGPGWVTGWAKGMDHEFSRIFVGQGEALPGPNDFDGYVILGGEMNVDQESMYPWLRSEKLFIEKILRSKKPIFGICLGGQLIAEVLGAKVGPVAEPEFGWWPIRRSPENSTSILGGGFCEVTTFHWHSYGFEIPRGAIRLAGSEGCPNQAFLFDRHILGTQFHPEVTPDLLVEYLKDETCCGSPKTLTELSGRPWVQSAAAMAANRMAADQQRTFCWHLLDQVFEGQ